MNIKKEQFTPKKIIVGLIPLIIVLIFVMLFSCNGKTEIKQPSSLSSQCFKIATNEIDYAREYINGTSNATDTYSKVDTLCPDDTFDNYYDGDEETIYSLVENLKHDIKYAMYAEETGVKKNKILSNVTDDVRKLEKTLKEME